jgi:low temperature requirement protein LtrA
MTYTEAHSIPIERGEPVVRVTTLELFFDLVFVFTITQLTATLVDALTWRTLWHVVVLLGLIFWMYDGYAWLTNAVPARGARSRALLLGGMACYLVLAIALPDAFSGTGLTFGIAYLVINAIHAFLYVTSAGAASASAMRGLAPGNLAGATAVLVAGAFGGDAQEIVWTAVFVLLWFGTRVKAGFEIGPAHFVERHGLLVIVAIGESVVAIGIGAGHLPVNLELVVVVVLGLALSAALWWTYFGDEDETVEEAFAAAAGIDRVRMALMGFGYAHFVILLGVVLTAVGLKEAVAHPGEELDTAHAFTLAGGVALFLAGDGWFRWILGLGHKLRRDVAALAVLLAVPAGTAVSAAAALAATTMLLAAAVTLERRRTS